MVTVVDSQHFLRLHRRHRTRSHSPSRSSSTPRLLDMQFLAEQAKVLGTTDDDPRSLIGLLVDQVEVADVILLNKTDLLSEEDQEELRAVIHALNPKARC